MDGEVLYFATLPPCKVLLFVVHVWVFSPGLVPRRSISERPSQPSRASPGGAPPNASAPAGVGCDLCKRIQPCLEAFDLPDPG